MNKAPTVYRLRTLYLMVAEGSPLAEVEGRWVPARPIGFFSIRSRIRCAWLAFTGRCDLVLWPEDDQKGRGL